MVKICTRSHAFLHAHTCIHAQIATEVCKCSNFILKIITSVYMHTCIPLTHVPAHILSLSLSLSLSIPRATRLSCRLSSVSVVSSSRPSSLPILEQLPTRDRGSSSRTASLVWQPLWLGSGPTWPTGHRQEPRPGRPFTPTQRHWRYYFIHCTIVVKARLNIHVISGHCLRLARIK